MPGDRAPSRAPPRAAMRAKAWRPELPTEAAPPLAWLLIILLLALGPVLLLIIALLG